MTLLQPIIYEAGKLQLLDQRLLPGEIVYLDVSGCEDAHALIRSMAVRGAPAIGVAGVLGLAVELRSGGSGDQFSSVQEAADTIKARLEYLVTSRPTAVNLLDSSRKLKAIVDDAAAQPDASCQSVTAAVLEYAEAMPAADIAANRAIGAAGSEAMLAAAAAAGRGVQGKLRVLTHCNTGSLATVQYGTALGCVRALHEQGKLEQAFCTETRPYNQGARLTAFELVTDGIRGTLIADSAAAWLMCEGRVDAIVVGADRIAANGDTANKIGTCMLSLAAAAKGVPFFVAAPTTSIDPYLSTGGDIVIEQRSGTELTHSASHKDVRVVAEGIDVWNPAFDVASAKDITGIITEKGLIPKDDTNGTFKVRDFLAAHGLYTPDADTAAAVPSRLALPVGFEALSVETVPGYVARDAALAALVGPPDTQSSWKCTEVGDGNINFVYILEGPVGGVVLKQGLPYVRCVGEDWPLSQSRLKFEAESLELMSASCPEHVPKVFKFDESMCLLAMQYLAPPHKVLRASFLEGTTYPKLASQAAEYLASCLFHTSLLALGNKEFKALADKFTNAEMCELTEQVIFKDPYYAAPVNRHTTPQLDAVALSFRTDDEAKLAALAAKAKFSQTRQALLHGDLHTGSCMVTQDTFFVFDTEFAFCGPMAFDVGKFLANLLLTYFATAGHSTNELPRGEQRKYLLQTVKDTWNTFSARFLKLWQQEGSNSGLYAADVMTDELTVTAQTAFMQTLFDDALLFGGCVMIRRILGIAHIADLDTIADQDVRAACEKRALHMGRELLTNHAEFNSIEAVTALALELDERQRLPSFPGVPA